MKVSLQQKPQQVPLPTENSPTEAKFIPKYFNECGPVSNAKFMQGQYVKPMSGDDHIENT